MPRRGDEANRLGNEYESLWIADSLLDILLGEAATLLVAAFGSEGQGIDIIKRGSDGVREFHSLKRQTTYATWSLRELSDRNVIAELFQKLSISDENQAVFVSATTANELNELCERAERSQSLSAFGSQLDSSSALKTGFEQHILPHCDSDWKIGWNRLRRLRVAGITSSELQYRIEQKIRQAVQKVNQTDLVAKEVRLLLSDLVLDWLGQEIEKPVILRYLEEHGLCERQLRSDQSVVRQVQRITEAYLANVRAELIHGNQIVRSEAQEAFTGLTQGEKRVVAILGTAGLGKSCVVSQVVEMLQGAGVPHIVLRLDNQIQATTPLQLGHDLGLPDSPCLVLQALAKTATSVIILDQLDALSTASGRNPRLWSAVEELLNEVKVYPKMRILTACRVFDAEHDHRLRRLLANEETTLRLELQLLSEEQIREALSKTGVLFDHLQAKQLQILRTPLHLHIYLQTIAEISGAFTTVKDLYDRYWDAKQAQVHREAGRAVRFTEIVRKLATWLSDHQALSAPADVLDEFSLEAREMASAHVLVFAERRWRFFHETFFDYAFARSFCADGGRLVDLLINSGTEQHLFRRSQVRQILTYQRDRDNGSYLADLKLLLTDDRVRYHLKKLTLDWLRSLETPSTDEWHVLTGGKGDVALTAEIRMVVHNSSGWFDILAKDRVWTHWISSEDFRDEALWLLSLPELNKRRSTEISKLLAPLVDGTPHWRKRFAKVFRHCQPHYSREMFELFLKTVSEGHLDDLDRTEWYFLVDIARENRGYAIEFLAVYLDRWILRFREREEDDDPLGRFHEVDIPDQFFEELGRDGPCVLAATLFPKLVAVIRQNPKDVQSQSHLQDKIWSWRTFGEVHGFRELLLKSVREGLMTLAKNEPDELDRLFDPVLNLQQDTIAFLVLSAWSGNPERYAEQIVSYLCSFSARLDVGYFGCAGGRGSGFISRSAVQAVASICSKASYLQLEQAILSFENASENAHPRSRGYRRFLLLGALPGEKRTSSAQAHFEQLSRKFPNETFGPPEESKVFTIDSPIDSVARTRMTDKQWVRAMYKYGKKGRNESYLSWRKGGRDELANALKEDASRSKKRFAALLLKLPIDVHPVFFERLLDGLSETELSGTDADDLAERTRALDIETLTAVLRKVHALPGRPCGREISWAIRKVSAQVLPEELLEVVAYYAENDPDPEKEVWRPNPDGAIPLYGGDPEFAGLNCTRGSAAHTIAALLFADPNRWHILRRAIESTTCDRSLAVRTMAISCLTAALNVCRDWAVERFLLLSENAEEICRTHNSDRFLQYASQSHYQIIRPLLFRMLMSSTDRCRKVAARRVAVAVLLIHASEEDLESVLRADAICRAAAASVISEGLGYEQIRPKAREYLRLLFRDPDKAVREATHTCFRDLPHTVLAQESDLIRDFIRSDSFPDGAAQLGLALKECTELLPDTVCEAAERLLQLREEKRPVEPFDNLHSSGHYIAEVVMRLHQQTESADIKSRCLDIIDAMLRLALWRTDEELQKIER